MPLRYVDGRNPASFNSRPDPPCADAAGVGLDVLSRKVMEALQSYVRLLRIVTQFVDVHLKHESGIFGNMRCREGYALMAGDDPCLSGLTRALKPAPLSRKPAPLWRRSKTAAD